MKLYKFISKTAYKVSVDEEFCSSNDIIIPAFFKEKRGLYATELSVRPFVGLSVRPSICLSVCQQFTSISSYTIDARITKLICMVPLCNMNKLNKVGIQF